MKSNGVMARKRRIFTILLGCTIVSILFMLNTNTVSDIQRMPCKILALDPWDAALKPFLWKPTELICRDSSQLMYVNDSGWLNINTSFAHEYRIDISLLKCVYQKVTRVNGDMELKFGEKYPLKLPEIINSHVFRVNCVNDSATVYDMAHFNHMWNENAKPDASIDIEGPDKLSVIIIGIDSVSRSHAVRNLPKSYKFLTDELNMYEFIGHSKVGENTWPNLVPLLTGQSHRKFPLIEHLHLHADSMPLLWKEPSVQHMATFFAEDRPDISTFNFVKSGFKYNPTDFYFRPYTLAQHQYEPHFLRPLGKPSWDCYGHRNHFDLQIEYLKGFLTKYRGKRKLAYFWSNQAGHESFSTLSRFDEPLFDFLNLVKRTNVTNNAIFFVLSDHGFRIGGASLTHIGRAENNKPWLMMHVPKHVKDRYPWIHETLTQNTERLVSPYDTYQTILDIINGVAFQKRESVPVSMSVTRRNLFTSIPIDRTCADAGVEEKYCTCRDKVFVSPSLSLSKSLANQLVIGINRILSNVTNVCARFDLHNISEVSVVYSSVDELNIPDKQKEAEKTNWLFDLFKSHGNSDTQTGRYTVLFRTVPGFGYFEGTIDYSMFAAIGKEYTQIGEPSRLDRYGNQSHCVKDSFLKLYCYCNDLV